MTVSRIVGWMWSDVAIVSRIVRLGLGLELGLRLGPGLGLGLGLGSVVAVCVNVCESASGKPRERGGPCA